jgi:hypothetical protein
MRLGASTGRCPVRSHAFWPPGRAARLYFEDTRRLKQLTAEKTVIRARRATARLARRRRGHGHKTVKKKTLKLKR